jgi:TonB family protein
MRTLSVLFFATLGAALSVAGVPLPGTALPSNNVKTNEPQDSPARIGVMPTASAYYPEIARQLSIQGKTTIEACVDESASLLSVRVHTPSGYAELDAAAIELSKNGRYRAALKNGQNVAGCAKFRVNFVIDGNSEPNPICRADTPQPISTCTSVVKLDSDVLYYGAVTLGRPDGFGRGYFPDGQTYIGHWKFGHPHGAGREYSSDGSLAREGEWKKGALIRSFPISTSTLPQFSLLPLSSLVTQARRSEDDWQKVTEAEQPLKALFSTLTTRTLILATENARKNGRRTEPTSDPSAQRYPPARIDEPAATPSMRLSDYEEKRVALVIGNAAYERAPLLNPVNDSHDMSRVLQSRGFKVISITNASLSEMRRATRQFADEIIAADVALFFYSGHGLEVDGRNYLVPVNTDIQREYEVADQAYDANQIIDMLQRVPTVTRSRVNILIVDACRDNPLVRSWRNASRGLAKMDAPTGTLIAFATAPGRVASDGTGRNSPFTKHLLSAIQKPNEPIELVFKTVRRAVVEETKGEQVPWENSSLIGDFYFTVAPRN